MYHRLREPFGKAGLIVAMVALVAALGGSAIAANTASDSGKRNAKAKKKQGGLNGKQKNQVRNISKQEARKFANSNPGAAGLQGPQGFPGAPGPKGDKGDKGSSGSDGDDGASVIVANEGEGPNCEDGGVAVRREGESTTANKYVCNGKTGFTETLPPEETETGAWSLGPAEGPGAKMVSFSYNIPLEDPISVAGCEEPPAFCTNIHYLEVGEGETTDCPGNVTEPDAAPGHLCIYASTEEKIEYQPFLNQSFTSGVAILMPHEAEGIGVGTWAVTAPTA